MDITKKKIVFIDYDGTLAHTRTGHTFPVGIWDMELDLTVFERLRLIQPLAVFVVTNQGGLHSRAAEQSWAHKFIYSIEALTEYLNGSVFVAGRWCTSDDDSNPDRKPNTGMLSALLDEFVAQNGYTDITKEDCIMIGDASGGPNDWSDSDRRTAANFGIDYLDVNELKELVVPEPLFRLYNFRTRKFFVDATGPVTFPHLIARSQCKKLNAIAHNPDWGIVNMWWRPPVATYKSLPEELKRKLN